MAIESEQKPRGYYLYKVLLIPPPLVCDRKTFVYFKLETHLVSSHASELVRDFISVGADGTGGVSGLLSAFGDSSNGSFQADSVLTVIADNFLLGWNNVASAATANSVHWSDRLASQLFTLEFLIEGEHGTLGSSVGVTDTSSATIEWAGLWFDVMGLGLWRGNFGWGELAIVASTANAGVVVGGVWSWFVGGEAHCD